MIGRIFMTDKMRQARHDTAVTRIKEEIQIAGNEIYDRLKADVLIAQNKRGRDYITHILERKVGKCYALMRIASETGYPIIVHNSTWADCMKREAKKKYGWDIDVISFRSIPIRIDGMKCDVMLKDEMVDIVDVRDRLIEGRLGWVSIVGVN